MIIRKLLHKIHQFSTFCRKILTSNSDMDDLLRDLHEFLGDGPHIGQRHNLLVPVVNVEDFRLTVRVPMDDDAAIIVAH